MLDLSQITTKLSVMGINYAMKVLGALLIIAIGGYCIKRIRIFLHARLKKTKYDDTFNNFIASSVSAVLWIFILIAMLAKFGIEIAPIIAGLGLAGFAIGFAVQGSLSNFAAGVMMIILKPFKVGDYVDVAGAKGIVKDIGIMTCILSTLDNKKIIVPNAKIFGETITNFNGYDTRRVDFDVGIGYGSSIEKAKEILLETMRGISGVRGDPAPMAGVADLGDSSVKFTVRVWCRTDEYWNVFFAGNESIKEALDAAGIEIPFPQRTVWMREAGEK